MMELEEIMNEYFEQAHETEMNLHIELSKRDE